MITGHNLLADWLFLFAWVLAFIYAAVLTIESPQARAPVLGVVALGLVAAGLWVL